jgi:integrase
MAPRKRKDAGSNWLPDRVYQDKSAYYYRPAGAKAKRLCAIMRDSSGAAIEPPEQKRNILIAYEKAVSELAEVKDISYWLSKFLVSDKFLSLGRATQEDYRRYIEVLVDTNNPQSKATHNGIRYTFGKMIPRDVKPTHIRKYMDYWSNPRSVTLSSGKELSTQGKPSTANKHLACMQTFFKWLRQYLAGMENNPADGITKFKEQSRQIYITDEQYMLVLEAALNSTTPWLMPYLEIAYLCGMRRAEVWDLNIEDIVTQNGEKHLTIKRKKGSRGELIPITGHLKQAIAAAIAMHPAGKPEPLTNRPLIRNTRGDRITKSSLQNAIDNMRAATGIADIRTHDMKKKAGTDGKDLGHRTKRMAELYDLSIKIGKATR